MKTRCWPFSSRPPRVYRGSGRTARAENERSDVTDVPARGVIAEAHVARALADAMLEKFGGDSLTEIQRNLDAYLSHLSTRLGS